MDEKLEQIISQNVVKISTSYGMGTGFFIGKGVIITCAHVVARTSVNVSWKNKVLNVKHIWVNEESDLAILEVDKINREFVLLGGQIALQQKVYIHGYSMTNKKEKKGDITADYEGMENSFYKFKSAQFEEGMSGSPIFNMQTGLVCGIVKSTRDKRSDLGGKGIPINYTNMKGFRKNLEDQMSCDSQNSWFNILSQYQQNEFNAFWGEFKTDQEYRKQIYNKIKIYYDRLGGQPVPGTKSIKYRDLIQKALLLDFTGRDEYNKLVDGMKLFEEVINSSDELGIIIESNPGTGKTTFNYVAFGYVINYWENLGKIPLFIDLRLRTSKNGYVLGTKEWLAQHLLDFYDIDYSMFQYIIRNSEEVVLIIEAVDEYLATYDLENIFNVFQNEMFQMGKLLLSCRTPFYARYMNCIPKIRQLKKIELLTWNDKKVENYIDLYFAFLKVKDKRKKNIIKRKIRYSENLHTLACTPLHLNMLLDLLYKKGYIVDKVDSILSLYSEYTYYWLTNEKEKSRIHELSDEEKIKILEIISWSFYEYSEPNKDIYFTREKLDNILSGILSGDVGNKTKEILRNTFFVETRDNENSGNIYTIRFIHKSFQEYFIASYIFRIMQENATELASIMRTYCSSKYLSEFLRQYIQSASKKEIISGKIARNCIEAYKANLNNDELSVNRIAREELAYNMGILHNELSDRFLKEQLKMEKDVFVRRAIMFGLAFGGDSQYRNMYVDLLRRERMEGISTEENDSNIGYSLTFFGDQPVDIHHPDQDLGQEGCDNIIKRNLYLFNTESDFAGWRLNLYTIIDLYKYREVSKQRQKRIMHENLSAFKKVLKKFKKDVRCKDWPELGELEDILEQIENE